MVLLGDNNNQPRSAISQSVIARSGATLALLTIVYAIAISAVTRQLPQAADFGRLGASLFGACGLTLFALLLRYVRWRWLLAKHDRRIPFVSGLLPYFAGFALTATPGKVGELLRIRYFSRMGVPASHVISCFVFEMSTDLVALSILSLPTAVRVPGTVYGLIFAILILVAIFSASRSRSRFRLIRSLRRTGWRRSAITISKVGRGIGLMSRFADLRAGSVALLIGLMAWAIQASGLILVVSTLGFSAASLDLLSVMPAAMLLGAASMVPGGLGATEAAAVFLLNQLGLDLPSAALVVIAVRVTSLWFATALGFGAIICMALAGVVRTRPRSVVTTGQS